MKKSELDKKYQAAKQWIKDKEKKGNKKTTTKSSTTLDKKYQAAKQYLSAREIGLDTFETDINKLNKSINTATSGWQTQETMKNTLSSIRSMSDRLDKYQEYRTQYGNDKLPDLSELQKSYKSAIDNWGALAKSYSGYKDAKSYKKVADERKKLQTADLEKTKKDVAHLEATLETAAGYEDYLARPNESYADAVSMQNLYKDFLKKGGFESYKDIEEALSEKKRFLNNATRTQEIIKLGSVGDINSENYDKDYEQYVKIGKGINPEDVGTSATSVRVRGRKGKKTTVKSKDKQAAEALRAFLKGEEVEDDYYSKDAIFALMTEKEFNDVAYYLAKDQEDGGNRTVKYVEALEETLNARRGEEIAKSVDGTWRQYAFGVTSGLDQFVTGWTNNTSKKDYIPVNQIQYASGQIREDLYEDGGWWARAGYDLLNTTSNMLPSILMSTASNYILPGSGAAVGAVTMGTSARGNAYQQMLNLGYDKSQANTYANLVGISEAGLQYALGGISKLGGIGGKLSKAVQGIDNGLARFAIQYGGSMLSEGFEEAAQEVLNPLFMNIAAGYDTGAEIDWGEVVYSGLLGALSGGIMEGPSLAINSVAEHYQNKNIGQNIRDNNQIKDVFDLASNPEIASAYDTYTRYAKKGINAENVSDAQVGRLWQEARNDTEGKKIVTPNAYEKLGEMARTPEAKIEAIINDAIASDINKQSKKTKKALGKDTDIEATRKETADKAAERLTELGQKDNVEEIANIIAKKSVGEEISAEEVKALRESEHGARVYAENDKGISEFVKGMDNVESRIFTQTYDGNTDIEAFANSFNLVSEYAKHPESFTVEDVVKNKGVLSEDDAKYIYAQLKTNEELKATKKNSELMARARKGERGIIDDSVINYGEKHIPGTVHWNSLNERQRQAVTFAKGLYKALGSNLAFIGKNKKFNGAYNVTKDITFIDVFAGRDYRTWTGTDTIISTISHEITHEMKVKTPEAHKILTDLAFRALEKTTGLTRSELIAAEVEKLKNKSESYTDEDAIDEIVARACEDMLANSKEAKAMLKELSPAEQKTLVEKIQDIIQKIVDWIDEFLSSYKNQATSEEAKALRQMKEEFEAMSAMWDKALREMQSFNKGTESNTSIETTSEVVAETTAETSNRDNLSPVETESKTEVKEETKSEEKTKTTEETSVVADGTVKTYLVGNTGKIDGAIVDEIGKDSIVDAIRKDRSDTAKAMSNDIASQTIETDKPVEIVYVPNANGKGIYAMYFAQTKDSRGGQIASVNALGGKTGFDSIYDMEFVNETGFMDTVNGNEDSATTKLTHKKFEGNPEVVKQLANDILEGKRQVTFTMDDIDVNNFNEISCALFSEVSKYLPDSFKAKLGFKSQSFGSMPRYIRFGGINSSVNTGNALNIDHVDVASGKYIDTINDLFNMSDEQREIAVNSIKDDVKYSFRDSKSGMANDLLSPYNDEFSRLITEQGNYVINNYESLINIVNLAFDNPNKKATAYFGIIPTDILQKIEKSIPNLPKEMNGKLFKPNKDYSVAATLDSIRHLKDEKNLSREDIIDYLDRMADTIVEFDSVNFNYYYQGQAKLNGVLFKKNFDDGTMQSFEIVSNKKRSLNLQTVYMEKGDYTKKKSAETMLMDEPSADVQDAGRSNFNNSISNPNEKVNTKISNTDSTGRKLSEGQMEYFKDSAVRDEKGDLLVCYHGTNAEFNVFEKSHKRTRGSLNLGEGFYFTPSKSMAENYTEGNNPRIIEAYLNIKKPYEIYGPYFDKDDFSKVSTELGKNIEVNKDNITETLKKLGYDGIISRRYNGTNNPISSVVVFESEQAKLTSNLNPTENDDIRYQDREEDIYDIMGERDTAIKRAEKLSEDVSRLKELLKLERRITKGKLYNESSVSGVANFLKNKFGSKIDKIKLMKALKEVYTYMASADENNLEADAIYSKCEEVARSIFESIEPVMDDYTKKILSDVRNTRVSLTEEQKAEVVNRYGNNWPRYFIGSATVANDGAPLSSVWADWAEQYPDKFSKDITDADMGIELLEAVRNMKDSSEVVDKYLEEERVSQIATEIYNAYWNISPIKTTADKYSEKIKAIRAEHRKAIKEVRESQKLADDIHYAQKMREQKKKLQKQTYARIKDARAKAKQQGKEIGLRRLDAFKENAEKKTRIQRITSNAISLRKSLEKNSKDDHIHELLKVPVMKLLNAIDFSSKQLIKKGVPTQKDISLRSAFSSISDMLSKAKEGVAGLEDLYGHDLAEQMKLLSDAAERLVGDNAYVINAMSLEELKALDKLVRYMKSTVNRFNKFHVAQHNAGVEALGVETAHEVDNAKKIFKDHKKHFEKLKTKLYWNNLTPYYAFKNLGKGAMKILKALMDGQDKVAFLAKEIIDFTKKLYTEKEYKKWSEKFFDFKFEQPDGSTREFTMNVPQIMSLYCVSKQDDAKRHILHGNQVGEDEELGKGRGITIVETKKTRGEPKNILLTESDLNKIISKLDEVDRAKEVADALQNYMSTRGAELGNEVSMARWGINSFGIEDYFPIKVSDAPSEGETSGVNTASLVALLNMSFTHSRNHYTPESIEIGDVFDVFANHMSSMIQYNAMALPVLDMFKWMNVKTTDGFGNEISVKTSIKDTFGKHAYQYLRKLLADVNGSSKSDTTDNIGVKFFKNAKVAKVAANIRVALLQPTSYIRAGAVIDNKYLLRALAHKPKIAKSKEKSGMVLWKSLGYYETDVTRPLTDKIKHATNAKDKIVDWSLKGAEVADSITLGYLWNACELEIRDTRKDLEVGSPEFYDAIALRLRDVIYRTQVVDSQLTRSQMMRSKSGWDKVLTTFASESTLSFNLVTDVFVSYQLDSRRYGKEVAKQKNAKYMRKAITAYVITNAVTSAIATMFDAFRDYDEEDKDEEYLLKLMLENMATNSSFINKLPYINTFVSLVAGFTPSRVETDWMKSATEAIKETTKFIAGEGSSERLYENLLKSASDATGVAGYNLYRDIRAFIELFN